MKNNDKKQQYTGEHKPEIKKSVNYKTDTKKDQLLKKLESGLGIVTNACRAVSISRETYYSWLRKDPDFKAKADAIKDVVIDFVETKFYQNVRDGDTTAMIFFLKSKGKARGWNEKSHIELSGSVGLTLPEQEKEIYDTADIEKLEQIKEIING